MDDDDKRAIALWRLGVLGPLMSARLEHGLVRARRLAQRHLTPYDRVQRAAAQAGADGRVDRREVRGAHVEQRHPGDRGVASHRLSRVDLHPSAIADDHHATVARQQPEILIEVDVGSHFQDDVDTLPASRG